MYIIKDVAEFSFFQLRQTVFNFAQEKLAPKADQIDKDNDFPDMKVCLNMVKEIGKIKKNSSFTTGKQINLQNMHKEKKKRIF